MVTMNHTEVFGGRGAVIEIDGSLTGDAGVDLEEYVEKLAGQSKTTVLLDFSRVEFLNTAGIGVILLLNKKLLSINGSLVLFAPNQEVRTLLTLLGFNKVIRIAGNRQEALQVATEGRAPEKAPAGPEPSAVGERESSAAAAVTAEEPPAVKTGFSFPKPVIVECKECGSLVRARESGDYRCPDCSKEFTVKPDMTVVF